MSSISTSPADIYGGTWSAISGGKYMRANSTWGNGGSNTISTNQMPAHTHSMKLGHLSGSTNDGSWPMYVEDTRTTSGHLGLTSWQNSYNVHTSNILSTGGGRHSIQRIKTYMLGTELPSRPKTVEVM